MLERDVVVVPVPTQTEQEAAEGAPRTAGGPIQADSVLPLKEAIEMAWRTRT